MVDNYKYDWIGGEKMYKKFKTFFEPLLTILISIVLVRIDIVPFNYICMIVFSFIMLIYANCSEDKLSVLQRILRNIEVGIVIVIGAISIFIGNQGKMRPSFPEGTDLSELQISFDELLLEYADSENIHYLTKEIKDELKLESIKFESYDYDVVVSTYHFADGELVFDGVPAGNCLIEIKFENYDLISENIKLNKKDQNAGRWEHNITLRKESDYKSFGIYVFDQEGEPLSEEQCDIYIESNEYSIEGMTVASNGLLPYKFMSTSNQTMKVILYNQGEKYEENIYVESVSGDVRVMFAGVFSSATLEKMEYKKKQDEQKEVAETLKKQEMELNPRLLLENMDKPNTTITRKAKDILEYGDALTEYGQEKRKNFLIKKDGPVWIEFSHSNLTQEATAWKIDIVDNMGENYLTFYSQMNKVNTVSQFVGLVKGNYSVVVQSYNYFSDAEFVLKIKSVTMDNFEKEKNDDILSANATTQLINNEVLTIYGNIGNSYDCDYYQINVEQDGVLGMSFYHDNFTEDTLGWKVSLINFNSDVLVEYTLNWKNTQTYSPNIGIPSGTYYILVERYNNFNDGLYTINIAWHASDYWEKEFNDEVSLAHNYLVEGFVCHGSIMSGEDCDYYNFQCEKSGIYKVTFEHENLTDQSTSWVISVLDQDSESVSTEPLYSCNNQRKVEQDVSLKEGETYYVLVDRYNNFQNSDYTIMLTGN